MPDLTAKRTLVKSPPELWEELSEVERLAKHLDAFGDIRITKLEPEHTVAWEGEHASGTVSIEPSGWGTKVTLTAELPQAEATADEAHEEPVAEEPALEEPIAEEVVPAEPVITVPAVEVHEEAAVVVEEDPPSAGDEPVVSPRRGFWTRLFGRRSRDEDAVLESEALAPQDPEPEGEATEPAPEAEVFSQEPEHVEAEPEAAEPEPQAEVAEPAPQAAEPNSAEPETAEPDPAEPQEAEPAGIAPDEARAVLDGALDTLGSAHHRPFSRG